VVKGAHTIREHLAALSIEVGEIRIGCRQRNQAVAHARELARHDHARDRVCA